MTQIIGEAVITRVLLIVKNFERRDEKVQVI